jgi:hypothetical protein
MLKRLLDMRADKTENWSDHFPSTIATIADPR